MEAKNKEYEVINKLIQERISKNQENRKKEQLSVDEKFDLWLKTVVKKEELVKQSDKIRSFQIGCFQNHLLVALSGGNRCYQNELPSWRKRIEEHRVINRLTQERVSKNQENRKKEQLSVDEKFDLWLKTVVKKEKLVQAKDKIGDFIMGSFQDSLLGAFSGSNLYYKNKLPSWRKEIEKHKIINNIIQTRISKN